MLFVLATPALHVFASANACAKPFLGLVPWFGYLPPSSFSSDCTINSFTTLGANSGFLLIALAILDDLVRVAALVAVGFVIYGGIQYITSQGSPEDTTRARQTIVSALIGVAIAVVAAAVVTFIGNKLGG